jgi:hypothetical protein
MSYLCDFCSRSVGSRCVRNLDGVRVGGSCEAFAPTLQSVFGLRELHDLLSKGKHHIRRELREAVRFNGFPKREANLVLDLIAEIPPRETAAPAFPRGDPVLVFESARERARALAHLEAKGTGGLRGQRGLMLAFADVPTLARAVITLTLEAGIRRFHVSAPPDEDV